MTVALKEGIYYRGRRITEGTIIPAGIENITIPLKYTEVRADIIGMLADVKVTQKFYNNYHKNIEAIYVFPLPHDSAVNDLEIQVGDRIIRSEVKERKEARRVYEEAKVEMKKAALLEQERPNIFTISVANIEPEQEILVNLRYHESVKYEDGEYEFVFPMTITPRYTEGGKEAGTDNEKISPPVRTAGKEINIFVNLEAGFPIGEITSPSHKLYKEDKGKTRREIQLAKEGELPNKDFILRYSSTGEDMEKHFAFYKKSEFKPGTFMFHGTPKMDYGPDELVKRELIFVIDRSGSMSYGPMEQAKKALKSCMRTLRPGDAFSIITFDTKIEYLSGESLEFNDENLKKADKFIDATHARGGTDILSAMDQALKTPVNKEYLRQIVFLTDGAVGNERYILQEVRKSLGKARVYTFGIGPSVNRYLLDGMAKMGKGTAQYLTVNEDIEDAVQKFSNQTAFPVLTDIKLTWKGVSVADTYPEVIPDLYFGQVLYVTGRFHSSGHATAIIESKTRAGDVKQEIEVEFPETAAEYPIIETIWARKRIDDLIEREENKPREKHEIRDEIIGIAMKYHLMSPYTSLVAVEEGEEDGEEKKKEEPIRVDVPSVLPEGLSQSLTSATVIRRNLPPPSPISLHELRPARQSRPKLLMQRSAPPSGPPMSGLGAGLNSMRMAAPRSRKAASAPPIAPMAAGPPPAADAPAKRKLESKEFAFEAKMEAPMEFEMEELSMDFDDDCLMELDLCLEEESDDFAPPPIACASAAPVCAPQAGEAPVPSASQKKEVSPEKINMSLKWLVRNQTAEGSWSEGKDMNRKVMSTSLGLLAFISQGHTNKAGSFKPQVTKALNYIQSNMEKLSELSLAAAALVFIELYNINQKRKEEKDARKALEKLKSRWSEYESEIGKYFAAFAAKRAVKYKLAKEEDFTDIDKWMDGVKEEAFSKISSIKDLHYSFIAVMSENETIFAPTLTAIKNYQISRGDNSGSIEIPNISPLDATATGIFIMSWSAALL